MELNLIAASCSTLENTESQLAAQLFVSKNNKTNNLQDIAYDTK